MMRGVQERRLVAADLPEAARALSPERGKDV